MKADAQYSLLYPRFLGSCFHYFVPNTDFPINISWNVFLVPKGSHKFHAMPCRRISDTILMRVSILVLFIFAVKFFSTLVVFNCSKMRFVYSISFFKVPIVGGGGDNSPCPRREHRSPPSPPPPIMKTNRHLRRSVPRCHGCSLNITLKHTQTQTHTHTHTHTHTYEVVFGNQILPV